MPITLTGMDADNDPLTFQIVIPPVQGSLSVSGAAGAELVYMPSADFHGSDNFAFTVSDGILTSEPAAVSITIHPVNDAPVADDQTVDAVQGVPLAITLTATDVEGDSLSYRVASDPTHGQLDGTPPAVTYTADADYLGSDSFTFVANDGELDSAAATVSIAVAAAAVSSPTGLLNDTGILSCSDAETGDVLIGSCSEVDTAELQDGSLGRDVTHNDDSDGYAGFSFTKLNSNGMPLAADAVEWHCVRDNVTGLIWEVKTESGLHSKDNTYSWFNSSNVDQPGIHGVADGGMCSGGTVSTAI